MEARTKTIAGCEATTILFTSYPDGAERFARVSRAAQPMLSSAAKLLGEAAKNIDIPLFQRALAAGSPAAALAVAAPALLAADIGPLVAAVPDVLAAVVADQSLVADLLANTTVVVDGRNYKLNSRKAIGEACGYNYSLLVGLVAFALEANFRGPFSAAFAGLLPDRRPGRPETATTP